MKYRAKCPACDYRFGRMWFFRIAPEYKHRCPSCGARIKSNSFREWGFSGILALPGIIGFFLWQSEILSLIEFISICVILLCVGVAVFPYVTKFDLKEDETNNNA